MADENLQETPPVEASPEPQVTQPAAVAPVEPAPAVAEPPVEEPPAPEPQGKVWKLKHKGKEIEVTDEADLIEKAQKGLDYEERLRGLDTAQKGLDAQQQLTNAVLNNPRVLKGMVAEQMGINPAVLLSEPQDPDPQLEQVDPRLYWQQKNAAENHRSQRDLVEKSYNLMAEQTRTQVNAAVFESGRARNGLDDTQTQEVRQFVEQRLRPSQSGTYTGQDVDFAVQSLYGQRREAEARLTQTRKIQETVKRAASSAPPSPAPRPEDVPADVVRERAFKEFVKEMSGG